MSKQTDYFVYDILDFDDSENNSQTVYCANRIEAVSGSGDNVKLIIPMQPQMPSEHLGRLVPDESKPIIKRSACVSALGQDIIRINFRTSEESIIDQSPILSISDELKKIPLHAEVDDSGWIIKDAYGKMRMQICTAESETKFWTNKPSPAPNIMNATLFPDGNTDVSFSSDDMFTYGMFNSLPLGFVESGGKIDRTFFSIRGKPDEKFVGTGERFAEMDLCGRTILMENKDAAGVTSRRCYKCVPFFISSDGYGVFIHTHSMGRLSLRDISSTSVQGIFDEDGLDIFFIGGGSIEKILFNYRSLTGFPPEVPLWSYGMWMGRMSYLSAAETVEVANRLRKGEYPCDTLHVDTGWFPVNWKCDWQFSDERFPDPENYFKQMREMGFHVSLWQLPQFTEGTELFEWAKQVAYLPPKKTDNRSRVYAGFGGVPGNHIDFTNPDADTWYRQQISRLIQTGCGVIKADFGENVDKTLDYQKMSADQLHNLYCLLYQKACFEATVEVDKPKGRKSFIWARAGWAGCQRYPVHWAGDSQCNWEGMRNTLRGGLHLGLSGFAYWGHDIPGFCGIPDTMASWPTDHLYMRWTQFGTFTSHMRYHGCCPREPYEYPKIENLVREWLNFRYALIPYLEKQAQKSIATGYPIVRAMLLQDEKDPNCWHIDDQYLFGSDLLVAPIFNDEGTRRVYFPEGEWVNIWDGKVNSGPSWSKQLQCPLSQMPVYARKGAKIPFYSEKVQHTGQMDALKIKDIIFDESYSGLKQSFLGKFINL